MNATVVRYSWRDAVRSRWSTAPQMWLAAAPVQVCGIAVRSSPWHPDHLGVIVALVLVGELAGLGVLTLVRRQRLPGRRLQAMSAAQVFAV